MSSGSPRGAQPASGRVLGEANDGKLGRAPCGDALAGLLDAFQRFPRSLSSLCVSCTCRRRRPSSDGGLRPARPRTFLSRGAHVPARGQTPVVLGMLALPCLAILEERKRRP